MSDLGREELYQGAFITTSRYVNVQILGGKIANTDDYEFASEIYELDTEI